MKSLKEFKYFDPKTKAPIPDPDVKLSFDKNGRPTWRNRKGQTARNPNWWVAAETKGEQNSLSNLPDSKQLSLNQVLTAVQVSSLEKAAREKAAAEAAAAEKKSAKATAKKEEEDEKRKDAEARKKTTQDIEAVVKNLSDSGTLQSETTKAVINADNIPIFAKDFKRIKKGIETVVGKATKTGLFKKSYTVSEGEPIENGETNAKSAQDIAADLIKNYLVSAQDENGKAIFNYSVLPVDSDMPESTLGKHDRLVEDAPAAQASKSSSGTNTQPNKPTAEQPAKAASEAAPANQSTTEQTAATPETGSSSAEAPATGQSNTITLGKDSIEELTSKLVAAIEPLLEETNKTITSSAKTIKFTCTPVTTSKQSADSSQEAKQSTETSQEAEQVTESKNVCVFRRLLEDEEPAAEQAAPDTQEAATKEAAPVEEPSEESSSEENKGETKDTNKASETPALPSNDDLKKIVDGLNKVGSTFETPNATYKLSFNMDNIDTKTGSFDIIVTSTSTTPKEGFWEKFWKEFGEYAKKAGLDIAHNLAGERGVMTV